MMRTRPGVTILELLISVTIGGVLALGASMLTIREVEGRASNQESLAIQQNVAAVLQTFSKDVRSGSGLMLASASQCRIRQVAADGTVSYVSYRRENGKFERGVSTSNAAPTTWVSLIDAAKFSAPAGTFTYYQLGNTTSTSTTSMRRVEIAGLQMKVSRSSTVVPAPSISAVMRESANARDLVPSCSVDVVSADMGGGGCGGSSRTPPSKHTHCYNSRGECERDDDNDRDECDGDSGGGSTGGGSSGGGSSGGSNGGSSNGGNNPGGATTRVQLCAKNNSAATIVLNGFGADWGPTSAASSIITKVWIGGGNPVWHKDNLGHPTGGVPKTFVRTVSVPAGASIDIQLDFKGATADDIKNLALTLYASNDGDRDNPYLITATLP